MWADRDWVYEVSDSMRLENWHKLNHYRNGRELCRKDLLVKNLKRKKVHVFNSPIVVDLCLIPNPSLMNMDALSIVT